MTESYHAGAYWGPRRESPEECARRAEKFFAAMASLDPSFSRWFKQGRSRKEALKHQVQTDLSSLEKMIRRGKDRVAEDLGFRFGCWNGEADDYDAVAFNFKCGGWFERLLNTCVFTLPSRGPNAERVLTAPVMMGLLRAMAIAWDPDWAECLSRAHMRLLPEMARPGVYVGWITYLSRRQGVVPPLPAPVRIEPVENFGTLILLTPERFTANNPEHVALAERVRDLLARAGILGVHEP